MTLVGNDVDNSDENDDRDVAVSEIGEDCMDLQYNGAGKGDVVEEEEYLTDGTAKLLSENKISLFKDFY